MSEELKPCPFCGSEDITIADDGGGQIYTACCDCACSGPFGGTDAQLVRLWNMRETDEVEWIDVNDELPPLDQWVIVYGDHECGQEDFCVGVGKWMESIKIWSTADWDGCGGYDWYKAVTHWMPLPDSPKR